MGNGVVLVPVAVVVEALTVERAVVVLMLGAVVEADVDVAVFAGGVDCAVVECLVADPQAATPSASTTAAVVR